ncbi:MAG: endonuclease/exonuclease/phosphatase family protein [Reichenbachiella sp.]
MVSILLSMVFIACNGTTATDTEDVSSNQSSFGESESSSGEGSSETPTPDASQISSSLSSSEPEEITPSSNEEPSSESSEEIQNVSSSSSSSSSVGTPSSSANDISSEALSSSQGEQESSATNVMKLKVMSYNTLYTNFPSSGGNDGTMKQLGDNIIALNPDILGTQETQDGALLEQYTNGLLTLVPDTDGNPIYYNADIISLETSGWFSIPRDNYAARSITYAQFKQGDIIFWLFNTHFPHKHNEAGAQGTHAKIAQMLIDKRIELGAETTPTVITGDFNTFASDGDPQGSFESNITGTGGFTKSYQAIHWGIDKIFHSSEHWSAAYGADGPHGGSDHKPIHVELTLN